MTEVMTLGVVGAGPMGAGIAQIGLTAGLNVVLFDLDQAALARSAKEIEGRIARLVEKGQLPDGAVDDARARFTLAAGLDAFTPCQLIVEAIVERLEPKQALFAELEKVVAKDAILATNTSSLSVAAIGSRCAHKERVCGLHFFNPVPLMKLVEVVTAPSTSAATIKWATGFSRKVGKIPVTVKDGPGFLVNLQGRAYALEALAIVQEGIADPATVDRIMRDGAGFRMGPFELMDLTGIDVNYAASTYIYQGYQHDPRLKTTTLHELMANAGRFGRKTGQGFFDYPSVPQSAPSPSASSGTATFRATFAAPDIALRKLIAAAGIAEGPDPALRELAFAAGIAEADEITFVAPIGEDCASACVRLGLDPRRTVAIDLTAIDRKHLTVMASIGGGSAADRVADTLRGSGYIVERIEDSPGFILQRILAMVANLGCELAQIGVGTPEDIDLAMKLAQNYPKGPIEWGEWLGAARTHDIMRRLQSITGSDRYRPSLWLRRRAQLGLSLYEQG